ncbi:MAG: thioredoxin family protein [Verrucomicrobiota bacterium]
MKTLLAITLICLAAASRADIPAGWSTNYTAASAEAVSNGKPLLLFFTATWCGPCKLMSRLTLSQPEVQDALRAAGRVAVDIDDQHDLSTRFGIEAVPTFVLLSPSGAELRRASGFQNPADFILWLTNGIAESQQAEARLALSRQKLAEIDRRLASGGGAPSSAAAELFQLAADRDAAVSAAAAVRLDLLARQHPEAVLEGLNDPRLSTRILVANALRARTGGAFDVDPWAGARERRTGVEQWRIRLASKP